jgi:hypothetical protein
VPSENAFGASDDMLREKPNLMSTLLGWGSIAVASLCLEFFVALIAQNRMDVGEYCVPSLLTLLWGCTYYSGFD